MTSQREVELPLENGEGGGVGTLKLRLPPRVEPHSVPPPLLDLRATPDEGSSLSPVQLLEGQEYLYEFHLDGVGSGTVTTDRPEVFDPDTTEGIRGRLRPGLYTGHLQVNVSVGDVAVGHTSVEVRSRKLEYLDEYRWMLRDIADRMSELVMQRFAATEQSFTVDERVGAKTLYQRFAFLRSVLEGDVFGGSFEYVLRRPYRTWEDQPEIRRPGQGAPTRSEVVRQMAGPGARVASGVLADRLGIESLPRRIRLNRTIETLDNVPNRFVAFALRRWRDVAAQIRERLAQVSDPSAPEERGIRECDELLDRLDALLSHEVFRDAGRLTTFPAGNQVLQKREGYRDIYRAYIQFEAAAQLSWRGGDAVYSAGQRDVATLYEYWVYLQLAAQISRLCDEPLPFEDLIEETTDGLNVRLIRGRRQILKGRVERLGRDLELELWYNRSFSTGTRLQESWTRAMRPDCSLRIRPASPDPSFFHEEVWLHFDAKYRIEEVEVEAKADLEGEEDTSAETAGLVRRSKRADWDRMHAYRDAIYRSSGAYVIYPGDRSENRQRYHEILPGLGAFGLRPSDTGVAQGTGSIRLFIDEVLTQVASQVSQHERAQYWVRTAHDGATASRTRSLAAPFLKRPPADTKVLLGWVKGPSHLRWIHEHRLYNLRADGRTGSVGVGSSELDADLLLLYGKNIREVELWSLQGEARLLLREEMISEGYRRPAGKAYFCLNLGDRVDRPTLGAAGWEKFRRIQRNLSEGAPLGAPCVTTWNRLVGG